MASSKTTDKAYMKLALELAKKAHPSPNPRVGCVIVKHDRIVGSGYHEKPGKPHAEVIALKGAGSKAKDAIMYVTLEPCCIHGKTPPCTNTIIKTGLSCVVIGCLDQNPRVNGRGVLKLRNAGISVKTGVLKAEAGKLNEAFFKHIKTGLPFVAIKAAISADGKIAYDDKKKKRIGSLEQRRYAHQLRSDYDVILVGINTVLTDNPKLTTRHIKGKNPLRVILDSKLRLPLDAKTLADKNVLIFSSKDCDKSKKSKLVREGFEVLVIKKVKKTKKLDWTELLKILGKRNITSLLIEGGSAVIGSAINQGVIDKAYLFFSPVKIRDGTDFIKGFDTKEKIIKRLKLKNIEKNKIGKDLLIEGYL